MTREDKDEVREKHQSWYRLKKGESISNYPISCKNLRNLIKKARNYFENGIAAKSTKEPKLVPASVRKRIGLDVKKRQG